MTELEDKNIHDGHRVRLLKTVHNMGLEGMDEIQTLEFILFYIFPRGNVNPLAHRLLKKFKHIGTVLDASVEDLMAVKGMGRISAYKLKALVEIFNIYTSSKSRANGLTTLGETFDYIENVLRYKKDEECYIFGFNSRKMFVADRRLAKGKFSIVNFDIRDISNFVSTYNVPGVIIAHNHPGGLCQPSPNDGKTSAQLGRLMQFVGVTIMDNVIVGEDGIFSIKDNVKRRIFKIDKSFLELQEMLRKTQELDDWPVEEDIKFEDIFKKTPLKDDEDDYENIEENLEVFEEDDDEEVEAREEDLMAFEFNTTISDLPEHKKDIDKSRYLQEEHENRRITNFEIDDDIKSLWIEDEKIEGPKPEKIENVQKIEEKVAKKSSKDEELEFIEYIHSLLKDNKN